ncbi:hypothetical protein [Microbacterium sp.]|uniref:hypothetical protein n=1 Tax=Microbacterium sp. TaxID=51671 RepID=UPI0039E48DAB
MIDDDDRIRDLFRRIDPARTPIDAELTSEQLLVRDRITATTGTTRPRPRRWWPALLMPAAAAAAVVLIVLWSVASPLAPAEQAAAATPPRLTFVDDGRSVEEVVADATAALAASAGPAEARRGAVTTGWYYQVDDVGGEQQSTTILPQTSVFEWAEDQSGSMTVYVGEPYWPDLSDAPLPDDLPEPGSVLWSMDYAPGEAQMPDTAPPDDTAEGVLRFLTDFGLSDSADGFTLVTAIESVQQAWTLTNAQHAAMLSLLPQAHGVTVLGTTTDRAGRPVAALSVQAPRGGSQLHLFLSSETGRIVGTEVYVTEANEVFPADAIISYSMWDLPR